jgi:hypothetical protein
MHPNIKTVTLLVGIALAAATGCNGDGLNPLTAKKSGELGNGDFVFHCDDGAACIPYSNDASKFPQMIATGSTFQMTFSPDSKAPTVEGIEPYFRLGPDGIAALEPGQGTIIARDNAGKIVDFISLKIVQPEGLVVYRADADVTSRQIPTPVDKVTLTIDKDASYRVIGQVGGTADHGGQPVAGSIRVDWQSSDTSVARIESYTGGVANIRAIGAGNAKLTVTGGALTTELDVEVAQ